MAANRLSDEAKTDLCRYRAKLPAAGCGLRCSANTVSGLYILSMSLTDSFSKRATGARPKLLLHNKRPVLLPAGLTYAALKGRERLLKRTALKLARGTTDRGQTRPRGAGDA